MMEIKVGDIITLGKPSGINYNYYGNNSKFAAYDMMIYGTNAGAVFSGVRYADTNVMDKEFKIVKITAITAGGASAVSALIIPVGHSMIIYKYITVTNLPKAIERKEILLKIQKCQKKKL